MNIKIALAQTDANNEFAVLRGSPERIQSRIDGVLGKNGITISILCEVNAEISSLEEEDSLWMDLLEKTDNLGFGTIILKKYEIWTRKSYFIWNDCANPEYLIIFPAKNEAAVLSIKPDEPIQKN